MKLRSILTVATMLAIAGCGDGQLPMLGKPPVIEGVMTESDDVLTGASIRLHAEVDSESQKLTYAWKASHGLIAEPGSESTYWIAPPAVPYSPYIINIALTVMDEFGRSVKRSRQIRVYRPGELPGGDQNRFQ